jgi:hypothetical protein
MTGTQLQCICNAQVIAADGVAVNCPLTDSEKYIDLGAWRQITFLVKADVGAGVESVTFDAEVAVANDGDWFASPVHDLSNAAVAKDVQVADVTISADTQAALLAIVDAAPFVRLNITNNGANSATVTVWAVVV